MKIGILGAGTWGVALASLLVKNKQDVTLWSALPEEIDELVKTGRHKNLKGAAVPEGLKYTKDIRVATEGAELILLVVASGYIRATVKSCAPYLSDGVYIVSAAKGFERDTLLTMTEVIDDTLKVCRPELKYHSVALSGPTHAEEVALGLTTSVVCATPDPEVGKVVQEVFNNSCMRVYTNTDVLGVEICGALKNIIALASGILRGMGLGDNCKALLMTRGIAEITRMGVAMGCKRETFMGLAGIGDLIVTCTSQHSRNNRCGELIGRGMPYAEAAKEIGMVVEGYHALAPAVALAEKYGVELPITHAVYDIVMKGISVEEAMLRLMTRDLKSELD